MTPNRHDVAAARARADAARQQLFGTLAAVQDRLKPASLARDAMDSAAQGVASIARKGADAVRSRPLAAAGVAGVIGLVMARGRIADLLRSRNETAGLDKGLNRKADGPAKKGLTK